MSWQQCLSIACLLFFFLTLVASAIQRSRRKSNFLREPDRACRRNSTESVT